MNISTAEYDYLVVLLKSVLDNKKPPEKPENLTFEGIYKKALRHHVANISFYAIERLENKPEPSLYKLWRQERDKAIVRDMHQQHEYELLKSELDKAHIRYIPLKGTLMKKLYPSSDMRYMCDIDMVVDPESKALCKELMTKNGYETEHYEQGNHDSYSKKPVMNVEIHNLIFSDSTHIGKKFYKLFLKPFELSKKTSDYSYELEKTYFFLHLLTHSAKHYLYGGIGFRAFMDIYLFYKNYASEIDMQAVEKALETTQYKQLCLDFIKLAQVWFGDLQNDRSLRETELYIFKGGAFGTVTAMTENEISEKGRFRYILSSLFPSFTMLKASYGILNKLPFLYPFLIVWRILTKPFINHKKTSQKLKTLFKFKHSTKSR